MVKYAGFMMIGVGVASLFTAVFIGSNSTATATANVIASNAMAFGYVEALLFSVAAASLIMGTVFLNHSRQN